MKTLFLDIASHQGCIACVSEDEVLGFEQCDTRIGDDELIPVIEKVLKNAGISYDQLDQVACVTGPGGFTSLRVAVSCANTIADQIKIPSAAVHMSDYLLARTDQSDVLWLHSTKKNELFVRGAKWEQPTHMEIDEFIKAASAFAEATADRPKGAKWIGELIEEHQKAIIPLNFKEFKLSAPEKILPEFLSSLDYSQDLLEPWYGRGF